MEHPVSKRRGIWELCRVQHQLPGMVWKVPAWVIMVAAYFQAVNSSLIIFGFAALETVLLDSGVYADQCSAGEEMPCDAQLEAVNLLFVVNASLSLASGLFVNGWVMDLYGTKVASLVANAFMIAAWIVLTLTAAGTIGESGWMLGFCLFAASIGLLDGLFQFANLFPGNESFIIGSISGFSDSSSVVFLIFAALFRQGVLLRDIFIGYICIALVANLAFAIFLMPWRPVPDGYDPAPLAAVDLATVAEGTTPPPTAIAEGTTPPPSLLVGGVSDAAAQPSATPCAAAALAAPATPTAPSGPAAAAEAAGVAPHSAVPNKLPALKFPYLPWPIARQACTPLFLGWLLYSSSTLLRFNFYVAAVNEHLDHLGQSGTQYSDAFGVIISCGLLVVLGVGQVMDRWGLHTAVLLPTIIGVLLSVVTLIPSLPIQAVGFLLAVMYRGFIFTTYAAVIISEFGVGAYGRLSGLVAVTAGALNFLQQPLLQMSIRTFDGDFFVANALMGVLSLSHFAFAAYYWQHRARSGFDGSHPVQWVLGLCTLHPVMQPDGQDTTHTTDMQGNRTAVDTLAVDVELGELSAPQQQEAPTHQQSQGSTAADDAVLPAQEPHATPVRDAAQHLATAGSDSDSGSVRSASRRSSLGDVEDVGANSSVDPDA